MFVICGRLANFRKKRKKKTGDYLYKSLIILLYSWLSTRKKKRKRFWQIFTILFSLVTIENLWKHFNLEFLTFNFIFWWNFASKNKACTFQMFDANQSFHVIQPHATVTYHFFLVVSFLWAIWSFIFLLILFLGTVATKKFLE
jgi:4-amino-4-deoxy-L-arabinose transferase-like glycosyltransferase